MLKPLTKEYVKSALAEEELWKAGKSDEFSFGPWRLTLTRDEDWALPFKFRLTGFRVGTNETWNRRYISIEQALLHVFNGFNENANVKNNYASMDEALDKFQETR